MRWSPYGRPLVLVLFLVGYGLAPYGGWSALLGLVAFGTILFRSSLSLAGARSEHPHCHHMEHHDT